jgi:hypothetical protein
VQAGEACGISPQLIRATFPSELTMWIDPLEANIFSNFCSASKFSVQFLSRDRCHDFKTIFAKNFGEKIAFFAQTMYCLFLKKMIITLVFEKNANFFAENWQQ